MAMGMISSERSKRMIGAESSLVSSSLRSYIEASPTLVEIAEQNRQEMAKAVYEAITNLNFKRNGEDYLSIPDPICCALDKIQASNVDLLETLKIWTDLSSQLGSILDTAQMQAFAKRISIALTPIHYLIYYLDPRFRSEHIFTPLEIEKAVNLAKELDLKLVGIIMKFRVGKAFDADHLYR